MEEIWKDIPNYEGWYQVSNMGRVRSVDRYVNAKNTVVLRKGRVLTPVEISKYYRVCLQKNRKDKWIGLIHRIVWEAFNGPIPKGMQVNHINENKFDNRLSNLNLMTPKENVNWGTAIKRRVKKYQQPVIKCDEDGIELFCYFSMKDASIDMGFSDSALTSHFKYRKDKNLYGYKWKKLIL